MSPARRAARQTLKPPRGGVAVRMYRQGLGDCFLLALATADARRPAYVLVDCGVHRAQSDGADNMRRIAADIIAATGGKLDVVIATHEHTDHLSGFVTAADEIAEGRLKIEKLWLAWTEDPEDALAEQLRGHERTALQALASVRRHLASNDRAVSGDRPNLAVQALGARLDDTLQLSGALGADRAAQMTGNQQALKLLREHAHQVEFLRPGEAAVSIPRASGARAYVLGPPRDPALLKKSKPSSGSRQETYLTDSVGLTSLASAALALAREDGDADSPDPDEQAREEQCHPFSQTCRIDYERAAGNSFFRRHYGPGDPEHADAWRQIEHDWLFAAEQLALDLDHHTNNTSLALAFEIGTPGAGRVLLFPGDAQVGNWLSWRDLRWGNSASDLTTANLLSRTVLYKVGHHASHNATVKFDADGQPFGLELMPHDLIALIPVDKTIADKLPGWVMPDPDLYIALKGKAGRRILRSDDLDAELAVLPTSPQAVPGVASARWRRSTTTKADGAGPLYYDICLEAGR